MSDPVTILDVAKSRGVKEDKSTGSINGQQFIDVGLGFLGGCERCYATIAAYNAYPTKTGFWRCDDCVGDLGFDTVGAFELWSRQEAHEGGNIAEYTDDCWACRNGGILTMDECDLFNLDGTGRDGDPRHPFHVADLTATQREYLETFRSEQRMQGYLVTLEIFIDPAHHTDPALWDWASLLDVGPAPESVTTLVAARLHRRPPSSGAPMGPAAPSLGGPSPKAGPDDLDADAPAGAGDSVEAYRG